MNVKIWGLRRSGTNYLASLLKNNFQDDVLIHVGKPKHELPKDLTYEDYQKWLGEHQDNLFSREHFKDPLQIQRVFQQKTLHIYIQKDIFAWLYSYMKYSYRCPEHPTEPPIKLFSFSDRITLEKLIKKYLEYHKKAEEFCYIIYYEDLINHPFKILEDLKQKGLTLKDTLKDNPHLIEAGYTQTNKIFDRDFYLKRKYLQFFTYEQIQIINDIILQHT